MDVDRVRGAARPCECGWTGNDGVGHCYLCHEPVAFDGSIDAALDHIRNMHPDRYAPIESWRENGRVISTASVVPREFVAPPPQ